MPRPNHHTLMCELSKAKSKQKKTFKECTVVEDGAKREGVVL